MLQAMRDYVESQIKQTYLFNAEDAIRATNGARSLDAEALRSVTFCVLVLNDGRAVAGESTWNRADMPTMFDGRVLSEPELSYLRTTMCQRGALTDAMQKAADLLSASSES